MLATCLHQHLCNIESTSLASQMAPAATGVATGVTCMYVPAEQKQDSLCRTDAHRSLTMLCKHTCGTMNRCYHAQSTGAVALHTLDCPYVICPTLPTWRPSPMHIPQGSQRRGHSSTQAQQVRLCLHCSHPVHWLLAAAGSHLVTPHLYVNPKGKHASCRQRPVTGRPHRNTKFVAFPRNQTIRPPLPTRQPPSLSPQTQHTDCLVATYQTAHAGLYTHLRCLDTVWCQHHILPPFMTA